jgi:hypothetical protein
MVALSSLLAQTLVSSHPPDFPATTDSGVLPQEGGSRVDYDRLGQIFSRFLQHPAFPRPDSLRKLVHTHVLDQGARSSRLADVFSRSIIRHHHSLVRQSFRLPPLTSETVFVSMEEGERKVYNALLALFSSNSTTSQRVDVRCLLSYLFSPRHALSSSDPVLFH